MQGSLFHVSAAILCCPPCPLPAASLSPEPSLGGSNSGPWPVCTAPSCQWRRCLASPCTSASPPGEFARVTRQAGGRGRGGARWGWGPGHSHATAPPCLHRRWLESRFHFSFADYWDNSRMNFGALRVVNDDLVQPRAGFGCVVLLQGDGTVSQPRASCAVLVGVATPVAAFRSHCRCLCCVNRAAVGSKPPFLSALLAPYWMQCTAGQKSSARSSACRLQGPPSPGRRDLLLRGQGRGGRGEKGAGF